MSRISSSFVLGFTCFLTYHFIVPQESSIGLRSCKKQMFYTLNYECLQIKITSLKNMDIKESIIFQGLLRHSLMMPNHGFCQSKQTLSINNLGTYHRVQS